MRSEINDLILLDNTQIKPAARILAQSFQEDPLFIYFFPNEADRQTMLPHLFNLPIRHAILRGEVYVSSKFEGVAVWLPSEDAEMSPWRMLTSGGLPLMLKMGMRNMAKMMRYSDYISAVQKRQASMKHWYLELIGVDPAFQGKGFASVLLKPMFTRFDSMQLPCYLETLSQKDVSIYQHYGFETVEEGTIPGTEIPIWAMLRQQPVVRDSINDTAITDN